jgi:hemerythrin-like domain-containing protein
LNIFDGGKEVEEMLPIGPWMIEHRLIERVIQLAEAELEGIGTEKKADPALLDGIVSFIRAYADRCHHGKEEDILFRELGRKEISPEHRRIIDELLEEHRLGRKAALSLAESSQRLAGGDAGAPAAIADLLRWLVDFYPRHIRKEDKHFFLPVMDYFSREEKDAMIAEGQALDSRLFLCSRLSSPPDTSETSPRSAFLPQCHLESPAGVLQVDLSVPRVLSSQTTQTAKRFSTRPRSSGSPCRTPLASPACC